MTRRNRQRGVALIVSLLLLIVVTVLAVSSIRMGTVNLRIVDNMQSQRITQAVAEEEANRVLGEIDNFNNPTDNLDTTNDNLNVDISDRECIAARKASGYSMTFDLAPEDTTWEYTTTIQNGVNGATAEITTGAEIRMTAGSCS